MEAKMNDFSKNTIKVGVSALIFNDEHKVLLSLRGLQARNEQGKWEIPGGEVNFGEKLEEAVKREVREEIGVEIKVIKLNWYHFTRCHLSFTKINWCETNWPCRNLGSIGIRSSHSGDWKGVHQTAGLSYENGQRVRC
jgi:mutator protein MutT